MNILCVGGGPGGLLFSIAARLADPGHRITLAERRPDATTYGWGIAVSRAGEYRDDLLVAVRATDPTAALAIEESCIQWSGQHVSLAGARPVHLGGSGYCVSRQRLIDVLVDRARAVGVDVRFGHEVTGLPQATAEYDLVVLADGAGSRLRRGWRDRFGTVEQAGRNLHVWLNCPTALGDFTYAFERSPAGWIWFYGYPYAPDASTVIVECTPQTWAGLGFDTLDDAATMAALSGLFAPHLGDSPLESRPDEAGRSPWAHFPLITNERWHAGKVVLLGDCAHTSHFSIGSGTKLALQDAATLGRLIVGCTPRELSGVLQRYEDSRLPVVRDLQRDAIRSAGWFDHVDEAARMDPVDFGYSLRLRRVEPAAGTPSSRRSTLDYGLHRATQWRVGRAARRAVAAAYRARQAAKSRLGPVRGPDPNVAGSGRTRSAFH